MAVVKPFAAIRPCREKAEKIAALPYDVYSRQEAKTIVAKNPESFLKIDRAETQLEDTVSMYDARVYQKARDTLWKMVEDGSFLQEEQRCYYIYELTAGERVQTGITACVSIDDYENGVVKRHENTREGKEEDRINHIDICNAQTGPIFLAYHSNATIQQIVEEAKQEETLYDFVAEDHVRHRVWAISNEERMIAIENAFAGIQNIYIADGHHRAASAVKVGLKRRKEHPNYDGTEEFNYFLSVLFPEDQLKIMPYNRVVKDLDGMTESEFLEKVSEIFQVTLIEGEEKEPMAKGCFSMYLGGQWYACRIKPEDISKHPVDGLDVSVLQRKLFAPVLNITNPKEDKRIDFVGGIRGTGELERRCKTDCKAAFFLYPTSIEELFAVADAGLLMPPKSTWFEPKLRSGIFIHSLE